jgi:hypothetical protein
MKRALWIVAALLACGCPDAADRRIPFTLLQANVGNTLLACEDGYIFKLCEVSVENAIRDNIAALDPDVIALQEVLPDDACDSIVEDDPRFVCHPDQLAQGATQMERLLGGRYDVRCDPRNGFECVAVRGSGGPAPDGVTFFDDDYLTAPPVDSDDEETCDDGFTVGTMQLSFESTGTSQRVAIVNGHPQSGFIGRCRRKQLEQAFAFPEPSGDEGALNGVLLSGDWNLDPFRDVDESADLWVDNVGLASEGKRFHYHSGPAEKNPPLPTTENVLFTGVLDHVASTQLEGACVTLGEAADTERLDGAQGGNGCDHRALMCSLSMTVRSNELSNGDF